MPSRKSTAPRKASAGAPLGNKNASRHGGEETDRVSLRLPSSLLTHYRNRALADNSTLSAILTGTLIQAKSTKP